MYDSRACRFNAAAAAELAGNIAACWRLDMTAPCRNAVAAVAKSPLPDEGGGGGGGGGGGIADANSILVADFCSIDDVADSVPCSIAMEVKQDGIVTHTYANARRRGWNVSICLCTRTAVYKQTIQEKNT